MFTPNFFDSQPWPLGEMTASEAEAFPSHEARLDAPGRLRDDAASAARAVIVIVPYDLDHVAAQLPTIDDELHRCLSGREKQTGP